MGKIIKVSDEIYDKQLEGLPKEVTFYKKCVISNMKFDICRTTYNAAHEIRDGHINRDEAVALVHKYDGEFPKKYWKEFLDYLDITEKEF